MLTHFPTDQFQFVRCQFIVKLFYALWQPSRFVANQISKRLNAIMHGRALRILPETKHN